MDIAAKSGEEMIVNGGDRIKGAHGRRCKSGEEMIVNGGDRIKGNMRRLNFRDTGGNGDVFRVACREKRKAKQIGGYKFKTFKR
ncbi:Hypothetical predicted protein [Octopus vulgaris]|uniref:Uncharacterized protein n=1 Tax=Octopus vulgaris TaxID=6645 RepID=A0AA36AG35_OCTVU|nr:Hypothetical predicted protein [Octopus vulgaris]